jgi:hypothetical protein
VTISGVIILLAILLAGIGLITVGVLLLRRRNDWLATAMGVVLTIVGAGWQLALIVSWVSRVNPFPNMGWVILSGVGLAAFTFWVIMLAECAVREESNSLDKLIWVLVILATNIVGALIYYFAQRTNRLES